MDASLYLSKLTFTNDPRGHALRTDLYRIHALMRSVGGAGRYLYRIEYARRGGGILLQTWTHPDFSFLDGEGLQIEGVKRLLPEVIRPGRAYRFGLLVNPTRRLKETGRRVGLAPDEVPGWLQAHLGGCILREVRLEETYALHIDKPRDGKTSYWVHRAQGVLVCRDPEALWQTLRSGVGRGKAFGLGMLSLAPAG